MKTTYNRSAIMSKAWASYKSSYGTFRPFNQEEFASWLRIAWRHARNEAFAAAKKAAEEARKADLVKAGSDFIKAEIDALESKEFSIQMNDRWSREDEEEINRIRRDIRTLREALAECTDNAENAAA